MWSFEVCVVVALVSIYLTHWIYKWRNPKCNGILPPGSSGIPLVGETLQLFTPTYSNDVLPFIKKRLQRHGPLFRTNLAGRNIIVSADYEFNRFIFGQEEKLVVRWYLDSLSGLIKHGEQRPDGLTTHKYMKNLVASHFGTDSIRQKLLSQFEDKVLKALHSWSFQDSIELEYASIRVQYQFPSPPLIILWCYQIYAHTEFNTRVLQFIER
ncbi:cytochrome p450 87a3 [Phtheirospermum japonicum]|uniref:Cytochrome p450 87a3 n=1 Tax=Phtheirospermum japonicum TaxID=374723 RepID=A0A830CPN7_9LAMI|nr:cytochrome p450 87a3 [Phtheirospermum japonicum]